MCEYCVNNKTHKLFAHGKCNCNCKAKWLEGNKDIMIYNIDISLTPYTTVITCINCHHFVHIPMIRQLPYLNTKTMLMTVI